MRRFWMCHWQFRYWRPEINGPEGRRIRSSGSNSFRKRGVSVGDSVYIVSLSSGQLYLGGRTVVKQIVSRPQAVRILRLRSDSLIEMKEWILGSTRSGTPLHLHRRLSPALTKQLRFVSSSGPKEPFFVSETDLYKQSTRGVREITPESALLFEQIIKVTDRLPRSNDLMTVTEEWIRNGVVPADGELPLPEEVQSGTIFSEGNVRRIEVNRYERDPRARAECINHYGTDCFVCGFNFRMAFGPGAAGYIHVHHLRLLAEIGEDYKVDPVADLRPVCPNCHAVLHLGGQLRSIDEVRELLGKYKLSE